MKNILVFGLVLIILVLIFLFLPGLLKSFDLGYFSASLSGKNIEPPQQVFSVPKEAPEVLKGKWKLLK